MKQAFEEQEVQTEAKDEKTNTHGAPRDYRAIMDWNGLILQSNRGYDESGS